MTRSPEAGSRLAPGHVVTASLAAESFLVEPRPDGAGRVLATTRTGASEWPRIPVHPTLQQNVGGSAFGSAPFRTDHLSGRVFFCALNVAGVSALSRMELVAKEIGSSLERAVTRTDR